MADDRLSVTPAAEKQRRRRESWKARDVGGRHTRRAPFPRTLAQHHQVPLLHMPVRPRTTHFFTRCGVAHFALQPPQATDAVHTETDSYFSTARFDTRPTASMSRHRPDIRSVAPFKWQVVGPAVPCGERGSALSSSSLARAGAA